MKSGTLSLLEPSGPAQACTGISLPLPWNMPYQFPYSKCSIVWPRLGLPRNVLMHSVLVIIPIISVGTSKSLQLHKTESFIGTWKAKFPRLLWHRNTHCRVQITLSWARWIQFTPSYLTFRIRFNILLSYNPVDTGSLNNWRIEYTRKGQMSKCYFFFFFGGCKKSFNCFALSVDGKEEASGWGGVITRQAAQYFANIWGKSCCWWFKKICGARDSEITGWTRRTATEDVLIYVDTLVLQAKAEYSALQVIWIKFPLF